MRHFLPLVCLALLASPAAAQVVVNQAALNQLAGVAPASPAAIPVIVRKPILHFRRRVAFKNSIHPVPAIGVPAAPPILPVVARPAPALPKPPAAPVPVSIILHFADGSAAVPPGGAAALKPLCAASGFVTVATTAPGDPSDPSAAMRLSLGRALAVRDALIACGVTGTRILPRALGDVPGKDEDIGQISGQELSGTAP